MIAFGFKRKRIAIDRPLIHTRPIESRSEPAQLPMTVYAEFRNVLTSLHAGSPGFYVGVRAAEAVDSLDRIEVAAAGLSFAELKGLKEVLYQHSRAMDGWKTAAAARVGA